MVAVGQSEERLASLKAEAAAAAGGELGERMVTAAVNLADWGAAEERLASLCQKVDFLVNNAGTSHTNPVDRVREEELDDIFALNLKAPINLIRLVSPGMKRRRFGSIVNVSSVAGLAALDEHVGYASSKAALDMVTKVSAKELGPFNVRVNSVNPTVVWTKMGRQHWSDEEKQRSMMSKIPLNKFAEVAEVVEPIVFLLSERASMINGTTLPIDGGFVAC